MFELSVHKFTIVCLFIYKWNNEFIFFQNNLFLTQGKIKRHFIKLCGREKLLTLQQLFWSIVDSFSKLFSNVDQP